MSDPTPFVKNIEAVSSAEARTLFALAAIGRAIIYTNTNRYVEEIVEVFIVSAGVNTVQLWAKGIAQTAAIPMAANQAYTDPGFALLFPGEQLEIICGAANAIVGHVRRRVTPYVA